MLFRSDVIAYAQKQIKDSDAKVIYYPKVKEDKIGQFFKLLEEDEEDEEGESLRIKKSSLPLEILTAYEQLKSLETKMGIQMRLPYDLKLKY
mgnify:CR=1 FL=1